MKEIKIKALTEPGKKAIKQHIKEFKKMKFKDKLIFKTAGYRHEVVSEDPPEVMLVANNRHTANPMFVDLIIGEIKKALKENGAEFETDYSIKVKG